MKQIKIGLPRAFLYYKYGLLWETFFHTLGCHLVLSPDSNKEILKKGIALSIDENCLASKIYMGHVSSLIGKVDYILVPRVANFGYKEIVCTKFYGMYDIVKNTFTDIKLLDYNIDVINGNTEFKEFIKMGLKINKNIFIVIWAYVKAKRKYNQDRYKKHIEQDKILQDKSLLKMLIVSHPYNIYDKLTGYPIINYLKSLDITPIYADRVDSKLSHFQAEKISKSLQWTYSKELIGAIDYAHEKIDGIIFVSTFPCGIDSLVNELCFRKIKSLPTLNLIIDELQSEAGLHTRLESFIDIVKLKIRKKVANNGP